VYRWTVNEALLHPSFQAHSGPIIVRSLLPVPSSGTPKGPRHRLTRISTALSPWGPLCVYLSLIPVIIALARIRALWVILSAEIFAGSSGICPGSVAFAQQHSRSAPLSTIPPVSHPAPSLWYDLHSPSPTFEVRKTNTIVVFLSVGICEV